MKTETLKKANELTKKIAEHESALLCFEYDNNEYENEYRKDKEEDLLPPDIRSTNPKLIIEHDAFDDEWYRAKTEIPIALSDVLIDMIKRAINHNLNQLRKEFEEL